MSKVIKPTGYMPLSHVVQTEDGNLYMVSSTDTMDRAELGMFTGLSDTDAVQTYDTCEDCKQKLAEFMGSLRE